MALAHGTCTHPARMRCLQFSMSAHSLFCGPLINGEVRDAWKRQAIRGLGSECMQCGIARLGACHLALALALACRVTDRRGEHVQLMGSSQRILAELATDAQWRANGTQVVR